MRGNGFKLEEGRFRLDIRKKLVTVRVVRHWNRLPRETVNASSLEAFKARFDGALSNLVWREVSLPIAGELELDYLKGPFQPKSFCFHVECSLSTICLCSSEGTLFECTKSDYFVFLPTYL